MPISNILLQQLAKYHLELNYIAILEHYIIEIAKVTRSDIYVTIMPVEKPDEIDFLTESSLGIYIP